MFSIFKSDPVKQLKKQHAAKLEEAFIAQRNGNIRLYSELTNEAHEIEKKIERTQNQTA